MVAEDFEELNDIINDFVNDIGDSLSYDDYQRNYLIKEIINLVMTISYLYLG